MSSSFSITDGRQLSPSLVLTAIVLFLRSELCGDSTRGYREGSSLVLSAKS